MKPYKIGERVFFNDTYAKVIYVDNEQQEITIKLVFQDKKYNICINHVGLRRFDMSRTVFDLGKLPVSLKVLKENGWRWKGLSLYQQTDALDFHTIQHGPIRLIPPKNLQHVWEDYRFNGIYTKTEMYELLGLQS